MRINAIQNNANSDISFKSLNIYKSYLWKSEVLDTFVRNTEVQTFVKYFHDKGKDISAHCSSMVDDHPTISMFTRDSFRSTDICIIKKGLFGFKELGPFNAKVAIEKIEKSKIEQKKEQENINKAMAFVQQFNDALKNKQNVLG